MTTYYMSMSTASTNFDVVEGVEKGETDEQYVHHFPLVWFVANRSHPTSHFVILRLYQGLQKHSVFYCHSVFNEMHKYCGGVSSLGYKHKYVPDGGCYVFQLNPKAARMCIFGKEGKKIMNWKMLLSSFLILLPTERGRFSLWWFLPGQPTAHLEHSSLAAVNCFVWVCRNLDLITGINST